MYAKTIISELGVESHRKLIKPLSEMGSKAWRGSIGIAGGPKFIVAGILFKVAVDVRIRDRFMYGGMLGTDQPF